MTFELWHKSRNTALPGNQLTRISDNFSLYLASGNGVSQNFNADIRRAIDSIVKYGDNPAIPNVWKAIVVKPLQNVENQQLETRTISY